MNIETQPVRAGWWRLAGWQTPVAFLSVALCITSIVLGLETPESPATLIVGIIFPLSGMLMVLLGLLIRVNRPENRLWWVCLGMGIMFELQMVGMTYLFYVVYRRGALLPSEIILVGLVILFWMLLYIQIILLTLWFPDGEFASQRWRPIGRGIMVVLLAAIAVYTVLPDPSTDLLEETPLEGTIANPFGLEWPFLIQNRDAIELAVIGVMMVCMVMAVVSMIARWRSANAAVRQQIKIVAVYIGLVFSIYPIVELLTYFETGPVVDIVYFAALIVLFLGYPLAIGAAILFNRLFDIDLIIRRTVMYTAVTALMGGIYFGAVTLLQSTFVSVTGQESPLAIVASTLAIAALFNPLRTRLQDFVDRRFNRNRYDAQRTLETFAESMRDEVDLDHLSTAVIEVVEKTMQPESVGLWLAPTDTGE